MFFDLAVERLCYTVTHVSTFVYHAYSRTEVTYMAVHPAYKHAVSRRRSMPAHSILLDCEVHPRRKFRRSSRYSHCRSDDDAPARAGKAALWCIPANGRGLLRKRTENRRAEIPMPYPGGKLHHALAGNHSKCRDSPHGHW